MNRSNDSEIPFESYWDWLPPEIESIIIWYSMKFVADDKRRLNDEFKTCLKIPVAEIINRNLDYDSPIDSSAELKLLEKCENPYDRRHPIWRARSDNNKMISFYDLSLMSTMRSALPYCRVQNSNKVTTPPYFRYKFKNYRKKNYKRTIGWTIEVQNPALEEMLKPQIITRYYLYDEFGVGYQPPPNKTMSLSEFQNRRKKRKRKEEEHERETVQGRDHMRRRIHSYVHSVDRIPTANLIYTLTNPDCRPLIEKHQRDTHIIRHGFAYRKNSETIYEMICDQPEEERNGNGVIGKDPILKRDFNIYLGRYKSKIISRNTFLTGCAERHLRAFAGLRQKGFDKGELSRMPTLPY